MPLRLASALFLFSAVALAQQPSTGFHEEVEVRVMDLDVVVTDRAGRPVTDLKREDFTVKVGGKTVPIDYFARVEEGVIHAPDLATASPDHVLTAYRQEDEAYVPRHFLIYVDVGHLDPGSRRRGSEALRDLVTRMGPTDSARIVVFDRRSKPSHRLDLEQGGDPLGDREGREAGDRDVADHGRAAGHPRDR